MARVTMDGEPVQVGAVEVDCQVCGDELPIEVTARLALDEDGDPAVYLTPDVADLWCHVFAHQLGDGVDLQDRELGESDGDG